MYPCSAHRPTAHHRARGLVWDLAGPMRVWPGRRCIPGARCAVSARTSYLAGKSKRETKTKGWWLDLPCACPTFFQQLDTCATLEVRVTSHSSLNAPGISLVGQTVKATQKPGPMSLRNPGQPSAICEHSQTRFAVRGRLWNKIFENNSSRWRSFEGLRSPSGQPFAGLAELFCLLASFGPSNDRRTIPYGRCWLDKRSPSNLFRPTQAGPPTRPEEDVKERLQDPLI